MSNIQDKVIIITGASSGIGEATAKELASQGGKIVIAARREERLEKLMNEIIASGGEAVYKVTDITSEKEMEELAKFTLGTYGKIDVLVNNAGVMPLSPFHEMKIKEWESMIDVNIKGVLYGVAAVLPHMRGRAEGHIINISSIAGFLVFPASSVYSGTKFAVRAITEGIRIEEAQNNIRTTIICPGSIDTELASTISGNDLKAAIDDAMKIAIHPSSIARGIAFAINQPSDVAINEMVIRPTVQVL